jgi:hypothetical protein
MIVLDTNVLAEFARQEQPDGQPLACLTSLDGEAGHTEHQQPNRTSRGSFVSFDSPLSSWPAMRG